MRRALGFTVNFLVASGLQVSGFINKPLAAGMWTVALAIGFWLVITWPPVLGKLLRIGRAHRMWSTTVACLIGAIIFGVGWQGLLWFYDEVNAEAKKAALPVTRPPKAAPLPIALTLRFDPLVSFPFILQAHTTSYAVLVHPNSTEQWGARELQNPGDKAMRWPENPELIFKNVKSLPDNAIALDLSNYSATELINVRINLSLKFDDAVKEGTSVRSGAFHSSKIHSVIIPVIAPKSTTRILIASQASKHWVQVSFPAEATALVSGESERRSIKLIKTGVNVIETLPLFSLAPSKVHWRGFEHSD